MNYSFLEQAPPSKPVKLIYSLNCGIESCEQGYKIDETDCKCTLIEVESKCGNYSCPNYHKHVEETCGCKCIRICPSHQYLDEKNCECLMIEAVQPVLVCNGKTCSGIKTLNNNTCICDCPY